MASVTQHAQYVLLFLVLAVNSTGFKFYRVARSYSNRPFLCALACIALVSCGINELCELTWCYIPSQAASNTKNLDVGANVFIGNLDTEIDEKLLYDIFSAFGVILQTPKVGGGNPNPLLSLAVSHVFYC